MQSTRIKYAVFIPNSANLLFPILVMLQKNEALLTDGMNSLLRHPSSCKLLNALRDENT